MVECRPMPTHPQPLHLLLCQRHMAAAVHHSASNHHPPHPHVHTNSALSGHHHNNGIQITLQRPLIIHHHQSLGYYGHPASAMHSGPPEFISAGAVHSEPVTTLGNSGIPANGKYTNGISATLTSNATMVMRDHLVVMNPFRPVKLTTRSID
ncbi:unnamed protein product [Ceratitis capitata]|uniref:(Mediterranean fruit fly) hypothetical protein n=1 Tax=Ceratitis capitata TaxID=7213 RepID=A0A811U7P0_CERCA|nr:unnamed protein product [Ceratitis capitata]